MTAFNKIPYDHFGVALRVSGDRDEDGCEIERITAADSEIDLCDLFDYKATRLIADRLDRQLSKQAREAGHYARVERMVMDRMMAQLPELTVAA